MVRMRKQLAHWILTEYLTYVGGVIVQNSVITALRFKHFLEVI